MRFVIPAVFLFCIMSSASHAEDSKWETWTKNGECFALLGLPEDPDAAVKPLTKPYLAIKNAPTKDNFDGVAVVSGFANETKDSVIDGSIDVDGQEWPMLVVNGAGFFRSGSPEQGLVAAMSTGKEARVTWTQKDGLVTHTYHLEGFAAAKKSIDMLCPNPNASPAPTQVQRATPKQEPKKEKLKKRRHRH